MFESDEDIASHGAAFLDRSLPKSAWTHERHFAATLWLLRCRSDLDLPTVLPGLIRAYNEATGVRNTDSEGYHETITQVSIRAARAFAADRPEANLVETTRALMASPLGRKDWLLAYWSRPVLFSAEARRAWVAPDIAELPF